MILSDTHMDVLRRIASFDPRRVSRLPTEDDFSDFAPHVLPALQAAGFIETRVNPDTDVTHYALTGKGWDTRHKLPSGEALRCVRLGDVLVTEHGDQWKVTDVRPGGVIVAEVG